MDLIEQAAYHALMFFAIASIAGCWAWGRRRGIPDGLLAALGIAVPAAGWLFSLGLSWAALLVPACYGLLWRLYAGAEERERRALTEADADERAAVEARLKAAPDDGAALLLMAQMLEREGRAVAALDHYEAAHRAADRMFGEADLAQARERLESFVRRAGPAPRADEALRPWDWAAYAVAVALLAWSPPRAAAVLSALAFVSWLRAEPPRSDS